MPLKDPVKRAAYQLKYRQDRLERFQAYHEAYRAKHAEEHRRKDAARYKVRLNEGYFRRASAKWSAQNPKKRKAQRAVQSAVRAGTLVRSDKCQRCGASGKIEGHHPDYSKSLEIEWLCKPCHGLTRRLRSE